MEATQTLPPRPDRRTGQIDALLFGEMLELLADAMIRADDLARVGPGETITSEANGRVLGISQACALVSGIPVPELQRRIREGRLRRPRLA